MEYRKMNEKKNNISDIMKYLYNKMTTCYLLINLGNEAKKNYKYIIEEENDMTGGTTERKANQE